MQKVTARGIDLLRDPLLNKGTAFTSRERDAFGLHSFLPHGQLSMELQAARVYRSLCDKRSPMEKYIGMMALQDRNEHLFYRVLGEHIEEFMPVVYTPTVGEATRNFSQVFRRGRGVWITPEFKGRIREVLANAVGQRQIRLCVVTDNESILGIGDQGAGGMAISVGKLALYTVGAGIHPAATLPVSLDVGTNNKALLENELYIGWRQERLRGDAYDELVEEFVDAIHALFPAALIQWEDFRNDNALRILKKYRERVLSFNDDIQGTGAVALAALRSAMRISNEPLAEQRILIYGAGAAGLGIARQIRAGMLNDGMADAAPQALALLDSRGLIADDRAIGDDYKRELAWPAQQALDLGMPDPDQRTLALVVEKFKPTVLIGSSGQAGAFSEDIVRSVAGWTKRPVILPFSNPTDLAEAVPGDLLAWTNGRALIATGSPFAPVEYEGRRYEIGQGNNVFIFPGLGLGSLCAGASAISDNMISAAAQALANSVSESELSRGLLFPAIRRLREVSTDVAISVAAAAVDEGLAHVSAGQGLAETIKKQMWEAEYVEYEPA